MKAHIKNACIVRVVNNRFSNKRVRMNGVNLLDSCNRYGFDPGYYPKSFFLFGANTFNLIFYFNTYTLYDFVYRLKVAIKIFHKMN